MREKIITKIKKICIFVSIFLYSTHSVGSSECSKDPGVTQKKMTHILRSLACSQAKTTQDCENAAGLEKYAASGLAGSAVVLETARRYRTPNIAACRFSQNFDEKSPFFFLEVVRSLFAADTANASLQNCQIMHADSLVNINAAGALKDARAAIDMQTKQISEQRTRITELQDATKSSESAANRFKTIEAEYYASDTYLKDYSEQIQKNRTLLNTKKTELANSAKGTSKYSYLEKEIAELTAKNRELTGKLTERKSRFPPSEEMRARLHAASVERSNASGALSNLEKKYGGNLASHLSVLGTQQAKLQELTKAKDAYRSLSSSGRILGNPKGASAAVEKIKSVGVMTEAQAKGIAHIEFLLDGAERTGLQAAQKAAVGMHAAAASARAAASKAMSAVGMRSVARVGTKVISGVVMAAGSAVAMAAEAALYTAEPTDDACFDDGPQRRQIVNMTSFSKANGCKAAVAIYDLKAFKGILDLPSDEQLAYFDNEYFCKWLNDVYEVHSPKFSNVKCNARGVSYKTSNGQNINVGWNENGEVARYDSYGDSQSYEDQMYSIYFDKGAPQQIGFINLNLQYSTPRSFSGKGFEKEKQYVFDYNDNKKLASNYRDITTSYKTSYGLQLLGMTEIKSCCGNETPRVEDETCYKKYGLKADSGSKSDRVETKTPSHTR
ncbi:MAG: hypothetical protein B7Y39_07100 [Bdellovibrio sp. 28-41-41]|nr:MAG: hypothetical protein B7Y39_07100 [Bdellovibrio sp. 28-41-41]